MSTPLPTPPEHLHTQARQLCELADWQSLCALLQPALLEEHPQRTELMLLAIQAHLKTARWGEVQQLYKQAQAWGISHLALAELLLDSALSSLAQAQQLEGTATTDSSSDDDLALLLTEVLERNDYDLVIQTGSGTTTLLIAYMLRRKAKSRDEGGLPPTAFLCLESSQEHHAQTKKQLETMKLTQQVQLDLLPPTDGTAPNESLVAWAKKNASSEQAVRILVLEDQHASPSSTVWIATLFPSSSIDFLHS